jgi:hypothetical protein
MVRESWVGVGKCGVRKCLGGPERGWRVGAFPCAGVAVKNLEKYRQTDGRVLICVAVARSILGYYGVMGSRSELQSLPVKYLWQTITTLSYSANFIKILVWDKVRAVVRLSREPLRRIASLQFIDRSFISILSLFRLLTRHHVNLRRD